MPLIIEASDGKPKTIKIRRSIFFGSYDTYKDIRKDYYDDPTMIGKKHCYQCGYKFKSSDIIYLSITEDRKKVLTCEECSLKHIKMEK